MNNLIRKFRGHLRTRGEVFPGEWYEKFPQSSYFKSEIKHKVWRGILRCEDVHDACHYLANS
jgi:hypothetical protein